MIPRVLLLTGSLGPGGTELAVMALARGLAGRRLFQPEVAVLGTAGALGAELTSAGIPVHELGICGPLRRPGALRRLFHLAALVRREPRALLHTFLFDADVYGMLAGRFGRPAAVITTRRAIKAHRPDHLRGYRWTNRFVDRIVCNSEAVLRFTLEAEQVAAQKVLVIPNGIELARFAAGRREIFRRRLGVGPEDLLIGSVGNIKAVKGQAVLFEAIAPLLAERPEIKWVAAGEVTPGYGDELRLRVVQSCLEEQVFFPGVVHEIPDLLAAIDLFVMPSLSEGMSNALIEAMAAGKPIVATAVGGNSENLDQGAAGCLVPPQDPGALGEAIRRLVMDRPAREEFGRRARLRAEAEYALDRMLERNEALYDELLHRGRP